MKRGRGRPPLPQPPYELFNSSVCEEYFRIREELDREARQATAARSETNKAYRDRGMDPEAMNYIVRLRAKVDAGKLTVQDAIARIDRLNSYADWLLGEQTDMFRDSEAA